MVNEGIDIGNLTERVKKAVFLKLENDLRTIIQNRIIDKGVSNTGYLLQSVVVDADNDAVIVGAPYAAYVEKGTEGPRKGPPFDVLMLWVKRKLGIKGKRKLRNVTWKVFWAIKTRGTKATNFIQEAIDELLERYF